MTSVMDYPVVILEDNGAEPGKYPGEVWVWGDKKYLKIVVVSREGADLTGATCTCAVYNSAGSSIATPTIAVVASATPGKYRATCKGYLDTSTTPFVAAGGSYTVAMEFVAVIGGTKRAISFPLTVQGVP